MPPVSTHKRSCTDAYAETFHLDGSHGPVACCGQEGRVGGPDGALVLSAASKPPLALSYWDLWFVLVVDADFAGSWERFVAYLRSQRPRGWDVTGPSAS